ncbi:hypothetical protein NDU88_004002 [Pleurodeles waltl]|uniref:Uncharacterized protein n=1 Tax=Pleurodeles waltl TaxID=8319 RepID=A0AAV7KX59_PLEWA|nr:hypothetical protein NDU88_004002 [Pleurodeles waltl]
MPVGWGPSAACVLQVPVDVVPVSAGADVVQVSVDVVPVGSGASVSGCGASNEGLDYSVANREKTYFILGRYA